MKPLEVTRSCPDTTDADLARNVRLVLSTNRNGYRRIRIRDGEGIVRLSGSVDSYFLRQMAIALAKQTAGVRHIVDDLKVDLEESGSQLAAAGLSQ